MQRDLKFIMYMIISENYNNYKENKTTENWFRISEENWFRVCEERNFCVLNVSVKTILTQQEHENVLCFLIKYSLKLLKNYYLL